MMLPASRDASQRPTPTPVKPVRRTSSPRVWWLTPWTISRALRTHRTNRDDPLDCPAQAKPRTPPRLGTWTDAGVSDAALPRGHSGRQRKGAPPYDTSERPRGGLRLRLQSVATAKPPGIEAVSSTSVASRTGSIGQYGAGSQVAHEIRAKQDSGASLSTASGRNESERVDSGWAGSRGGSLG